MNGNNLPTYYTDEEPHIHSHESDMLPDDHPLAWECLGCYICGASLHASNNECMQTWIEWLGYSICMNCAIEYFQQSEGVLESPEFVEFVEAKREAEKRVSLADILSSESSPEDTIKLLEAAGYKEIKHVAVER